MTLDKLPVGQTRRIAAVGGQGALRRRLLDLSLIHIFPGRFFSFSAFFDSLRPGTAVRSGAFCIPVRALAEASVI